MIYFTAAQPDGPRDQEPDQAAAAGDGVLRRHGAAVGRRQGRVRLLPLQVLGAFIYILYLNIKKIRNSGRQGRVRLLPLQVHGAFIYILYLNIKIIRNSSRQGRVRLLPRQVLGAFLYIYI